MTTSSPTRRMAPLSMRACDASRCGSRDSRRWTIAGTTCSRVSCPRLAENPHVSEETIRGLAGTSADECWSATATSAPRDARSDPRSTSNRTRESAIPDREGHKEWHRPRPPARVPEQVRERITAPGVNRTPDLQIRSWLGVNHKRSEKSTLAHVSQRFWRRETTARVIGCTLLRS